MLVYRGEHYCQNNDAFVKKFQKLYKNNCIELLLNKDVFSEDILTEKDSIRIMLEFVTMVKEMPDSEIEEMVETTKRASEDMALARKYSGIEHSHASP